MKRVWSKCVDCQTRNVQPKPLEMAPLPQCRVTRFERPFYASGLDYFAPIDVTVGRRREKRYGALFTCLSTRAVHVELANSLSTDSAIMAIRRFASRRGYPYQLFSDNGTNFRGAEKELREALNNLDQDKLQNFAAILNGFLCHLKQLIWVVCGSV